MNFEHKTIGVWGLGVSGVSIIRFLQKQKCTIIAMDKRTLTKQEEAQLAASGIRFFPQTALDDFFALADYVLPSPGINLSPYLKYAHKCISEVDIFYTKWQQRSLVITGSVGKTTTTHTLAHLLRRYGMHVAAGGNIGTDGMHCLLDMLDQPADYAVLELSSYQLERSNHATPDITIITNVYENHLDYHSNYDAYLRAKWQCIVAQRPEQHAIIPLSLLAIARQIKQKPYVLFSAHRPTSNELALLHADDTLYFINEHQEIIRYTTTTQTHLLHTNQLPDSSYPANWLCMIAALEIVKLPLALLKEHVQDIASPAHRLAHIATIAGVHFYNDSKATIPQATLAAVEKLGNKPLILLWGGVSKGVNRMPYLAQLASKVKYIVCFGKEADDLYHGCQQNNIPAIAVPTLEEAVRHATKQAQPGDHVLFSPAGASYDLFQDYEKRGEAFVHLVKSLDR